MFGWFTRKPTGWHPGEQQIFEYWDGEKTRRGDPLRILRELTEDKAENLETDYMMANTPSPMTGAAYGRIAVAVRKAFGVKPVEEGGFTEATCMALLNSFLAYVEKKNPNTLSSATLSRTAPASPLVDHSPMTNGAASPSTGPGSSIAGPLPSASA